MTHERQGHWHIGVGTDILAIAEGQGPERAAGFGERGRAAVIETDLKGLEKVSGGKNAGEKANPLDAEAGSEINIEMLPQGVDISFGGRTLANVDPLAAVNDALQESFELGPWNIHGIRG